MVLSRNMQGIARLGSNATMVTVSVKATVDDGTDATVYDRVKAFIIILAIRSANQSRCARRGGVDVACRIEVFDSGTPDVTEGGTVLFGERPVGGAFVEGQRMAVAEESALERVALAGAYHRRNADVGGQL